MRNILLAIVLWLGCHPGFGAIPQVPSQMEFAGMKLKITDAARVEMQKHVNSLRASDKYFKIKLDRVNLYFPIIERVFKEENLPDDFKYLVIQESALIGDAVSSANAVGFWQFKDFTGREVGLRIDNQIDERMNIVAATRGAAKYMKTNNFYYNNWVYALMAYNTGRGGARKYVKEEMYGVSKMTIDKKTHWYVKTFLAHKIAFQNEIGDAHSEGLILEEYTKGAGENLGKVAAKFEIEKELVVFYNKWLKKGSIPSDKVYPVLLPVKGKISGRKLTAKKDVPKKDLERETSTKVEISNQQERKYAKYMKQGLENASVVYVETNGLDGILARKGDDLRSLAAKTGVPAEKLARFNDLEPGDRIRPGNIYYQQKKKGKSRIAYHVMKPGESLWKVSQMYGVKLKKLRKYNDIVSGNPKAGTLLWLSKKRPKGSEPVVVEVDSKFVNSDAKVTKPVKLPPVKPAGKVTKTPKTKQEKDAEPLKTNTSKEEKKPVKVKIEPIVEPVVLPADSNKLEKEVLIVEESKDIQVDEKIADKEFDIHEVAAGQTLYGIAKQYGVTVNDLIQWNNLDPYDVSLAIGQKLQLKTPYKTPEKAVEIPTEKVLYHVVQPGETAFAISKKYDINVAQLIFWNSLNDNASINIGQKLKVSGVFVDQENEKQQLIPKNDQDTATENSGNTEQVNGDSGKKFHEVKPGDTLYSISKKYNITVKDLIRINNKSDSNINIGEQLLIKN